MPFSVKLEKRLEPSQTIAYIVPVASFVLALLFGAALLTLVGANPWQTYRAMLEGAFGTPAQWRAGRVLQPDRDAGQGHPAYAHRAGSLHRLPHAILEHWR